MRKTPLLVSAAALVAAGLAMPATAAPKPITKTYTATAPLPDPSNYAGQGYSVCAMTVPQSFHSETFKAPALGKLSVKLTGFTGDWDLLLIDGKGTEITHGGASDIGSPGTPASETMSTKVKKAGTTYQIIACNWAGGPTGTVTYTFTYA